MSSGGILVAPHAVAAAAAGGTVLGEAAAAVLAVRAASEAVEGPARGWDERDLEPEQAAEVRSASEISLLVWEPVVAAVVEVNARIRMLVARVERTGAGIAIAIPTPLTLAGRTRAEARRWAATAIRLLAEAQAAVRDAAAFQPADIETILVTLDKDANEREHREALSAAASLTYSNIHHASMYQGELRIRIAEINAAVSRRRLAAQWLAALEEPVVATAAAAAGPGPFPNTAAALRSVVEGDQDLGPELRAEGTEAVAWAAAVTRRRFVRELMRDCLTELGYTSAQEFDVRSATELALGLARPHWRGEHSAEVWVDQQGTVHGRVVREQEIQDDEADERDRERRAGFGVDLRALGRRLGADVVTDEGYFPQDRTPAP